TPPSDATSVGSDDGPVAASDTGATKKATKKAATKKATAKKAATKKAAIKKPATKKAPTKQAASKQTAAKKAATKKAATKKAAKQATGVGDASTQPVDDAARGPAQPEANAPGSPFAPIFQPPTPTPVSDPTQAAAPEQQSDEKGHGHSGDAAGSSETEAKSGSRRRRSRGGRSRRKSGEPADVASDRGQAEADGSNDGTSTADVKADDGQPDGAESTSSRRRRRRRRGDDSAEATADATEAKPASRAREPRSKESISSVEGSTRIEAKKQRRREGREAGRRRAPILSESEFLARRESVERVMAIRQRGETTQIAVLEDNILVEHYVSLESQTSLIGNVYMGRVQNVLPSMEAAFIDIGRGRNAVLYAGEVDWDLGDKHKPRRIENALKPGQSVLVQVSKDPVGHKGARLTSQINLPGRYLVYVPAGGTSGISRKLPDTERTRLKTVLKDILPDEAGVIIRTAAEGASEEELTRDVTRLTARWEDIEKKAKTGQAPALLYAEPDTTLKVVRDLFTEDFVKLVIAGDDAWDMVDGYVQHVAPDLAPRLERFDDERDGADLFADYRIDEQIAKALERKVWLPSGGSLVIDRTEAMTVVDVNTGKFTGSGGNLEETVTKNNLEAAEEIVRQLRLRDIGGIIVIDFIDMVLETNRDLVLRRLVECLGRDRTRHQVAEVTSLGLVQMTRKRIGIGLLEAFSHACETCHGRGVVIEAEPVEPKRGEERSSNRRGGSATAGKGTSSRRRGKKSADSDTSDEAARSDRSRQSEDGAEPDREQPSDGAGQHEPAGSANGQPQHDEAASVH
ncbi:MAG: Rne/Rng family ribonuclease, partial [Nocardioidaceae bacterium]